LRQFAETLALPMFLPDANAFFRGQRPYRWATDLLAVASCFSKSRFYAFADQGPLELRDGTKYLEHQLAGRKRCVYRLGCGYEVNPELPEQFERRHELPQGPGEAVELPHQHDVKLPLPRVTQQFIE